MCMMGSTVVKASIDSRHEVTKHMTNPPKRSAMFESRLGRAEKTLGVAGHERFIRSGRLHGAGHERLSSG